MAGVVKKKSSFVGTIRDQTGDQAQYKIGEILKKEGQITARQLDDAMAIVKRDGGFIGSTLLKNGEIDENTIPNLLSRKYNYPIINIAEQEIDTKVINLLPYDLAKKYFAFPVRLKDKSLLVAMTEPTNSTAVEQMTTRTKVQIRAGVAAEKDVIEAFRKYYKIDDEEYQSFFQQTNTEEDEQMSISDVEDFGDLVGEVADEFIRADDTAVEDIGQFQASDAPIIKLVNGILLKAIKDGISDVHIEPFEKSFYVRYRLDGSLFKTMNLPLEIRNAIIARFKIISGLDITEKRIPQDGRIKMRLGPRKEVDFRVSSLPTLFGESIVLRILDKSGLNVDLTKMGFTQEALAKFTRTIARPYGLVLVTGPTGSGKTTTLYSALSVLNKEDVKILTAEDPVEFNFRGINQVNVNNEVGMTFAAALKSFLRQDPDICMIGEIRDIETGSIATEAAMTGHLVFSTLHTNDCPSTVTRLVDMGIPPFNVASSVTLVTAQRLLRRICPKCKVPVTKMSANKLLEAGFDKSEFASLHLYEGKGCPNCSGTGYKGRIGVFEVMEINEDIAQAISSQVPESQLRKIAIKAGMKTLRQDALIKVKQGLITLDQALEKTVLQKESLPPYLLNPDEQVFENGDIIIREGNSDNNFYKLIQGCLEVIKGNEKIAEISEPDSYFGEMSALMGGKRTATIRSLGKSIVKVFPGEKLWETLENFPNISKQVISTLVNRLEDTNQRVIELVGQKTEAERTLKAVSPRSTAGIQQPAPIGNQDEASTANGDKPDSEKGAIAASVAGSAVEPASALEESGS
ncbi:MAG: type IV-A pilus assembly ATPase PilB [Deltaproteobacteria bacterium]|nr:type IV-A pilus assembly ATPase PilB [Deltaproteobacteria bacterium]MBW2051991.1 type IV-A pilus assembly ATPase PilB [Deltaproteobacteria bacterium]MBW2140075.1 type IV-A pilus assembly ATPase PilB [Deltaproteobacteria bacterium]MBW2322530.1 type IV-A pilus assembly ATPase PilB [Deltaproteobacteria bacterium]